MNLSFDSDASSTVRSLRVVLSSLAMLLLLCRPSTVAPLFLRGKVLVGEVSAGISVFPFRFRYFGNATETTGTPNAQAWQTGVSALQLYSASSHLCLNCSPTPGSLALL